MSPKTADYFPFGGVIATLLGNCKVLCYANMNVTLFRVSAKQISVFSITQRSQLLFRFAIILFSYSLRGLIVFLICYGEYEGLVYKLSQHEKYKSSNVGKQPPNGSSKIETLVQKEGMD